MKRTLVLTTESARHPFRQSLPPRVFINTEEKETAQDRAFKRQITTTFASGFVGVLAFIA